MANPDKALTENKPGDGRFDLLEARLYDASPLGFRLTTALIFLIAFGSFLAIAQITGAPTPLYQNEAGIWTVEGIVWVGLALSCILTAALGLSENGRRMWIRERQAVLDTLASLETPRAGFLAGDAPQRWRGWYAGMLIAGASAGLGFNASLVIINRDFTVPLYLNSIGLWFVVFSPPLYALGLRAGVDLARESGELRALLREDLKVDLFDLDKLHVYGRIGLRSALSWIIMAAIMLIFLLNGEEPGFNFPVTMSAIGLAAFGGAVIFISAVNPVRAAVRTAKSAELDRIREQLATLRDQVLNGEGSPGALADLTAYEQWVERRPEWPISAPITTRFAFYILIPAIPWFGAAMAEQLVNTLAV